MTKTKKESPVSVLAFEKKLVPSDAFLYGTTWENKSQYTPLVLREKAVRGTISNRLRTTQKDDPAKLNADIKKSNLQTIDSCALSLTQDTLMLTFTLKVLPGVERPSACNSSQFQQSYTTAAKKYIETEGFSELSRRYAINLANARFLWRNRVGAQRIEVHIHDAQSDKTWQFKDAVAIGTRNFDYEHEDIQSLAQPIADTLSGKQALLILQVTAYAEIGKAQEVYPSEELVMDKSRGKKSKVLYAVDGIAAMHSQKVGNAIRTIDTWYPEFETANVGPISVEPYGAVTNLGKAYRTPKDKIDFYTLFDAWARGSTLDKDAEHYVMATLVRGGVFGESGKE